VGGAMRQRSYSASDWRWRRKRSAGVLARSRRPSRPATDRWSSGTLAHCGRGRPRSWSSRKCASSTTLRS